MFGKVVVELNCALSKYQMDINDSKNVVSLPFLIGCSCSNNSGFSCGTSPKNSIRVVHMPCQDNISFVGQLVFARLLGNFVHVFEWVVEEGDSKSSFFIQLP